MIGTKESTNMENITLKQLLKSSDLEEVYKILHQKHCDPYGLKIQDLGDESFESLRATYGEVVLKLLTSENITNNSDYSIIISNLPDVVDGSEFLSVNLVLDGENMSLAELSWSALINIPIKIDNNVERVSDEEIVALILFEMTFWGFSEAEIKAFFESIDQTSIYEV